MLHRCRGTPNRQMESNVTKRKKRILWANPYCLLDLSSGASMTVREQLIELHKYNWDIRILGATIFDAPNGITRLSRHWDKIKRSESKIVKVKDAPLTHNLVKTKSTQRAEMTAAEEGVWYSTYIKALDEFQPDVVYYYGGRTLDLLIGDEAHARGIPVAAYLANGNFRGTRWCRDVDQVITNSRSTADLYLSRDRIESKPMGPFVRPENAIAGHRDPKHITAINPSLAKGAAIVAAVASKLEKRRPDIKFEVIESRGGWQPIVDSVQRQLGNPTGALSNVTVTPNQTDMRPVYSRARLLLIFSLWWESFPRVAIEATMNKIPALASNHGGTPEALGDSGVLFDLPENCHKPPYSTLPPTSTINEIARMIERITDDEAAYSELAEKAANRAADFDIEKAGGELDSLLSEISLNYAKTAKG